MCFFVKFFDTKKIKNKWVTNLGQSRLFTRDSLQQVQNALGDLLDSLYFFLKKKEVYCYKRGRLTCTDCTDLQAHSSPAAFDLVRNVLYLPCCPLHQNKHIGKDVVDLCVKINIDTHLGNDVVGLCTSVVVKLTGNFHALVPKRKKNRGPSTLYHFRNCFSLCQTATSHKSTFNSIFSRTEGIMARTKQTQVVSSSKVLQRLKQRMMHKTKSKPLKQQQEQNKKRRFLFVLGFFACMIWLALTQQRSRWRPGTVAKREIRKLSRSTKLLFPRSFAFSHHFHFPIICIFITDIREQAVLQPPCSRDLPELAHEECWQHALYQEFHGGHSGTLFVYGNLIKNTFSLWKLHQEISKLNCNGDEQEAAEMFVTETFHKSNMARHHAGRETVNVKV